ncbi:MAG: phosphodiester glycosidase family protein [Bacteroidales bacterium]|nr:phosphodiester glycosidase family protein [Bacteroidales bacterium]
MRKSLLTLVSAALCASSAMAAITIGEKTYSADTLFHRHIGPGLVNTIIRIPDYPLNVYLLEADMNNPYNRVETMQGQGLVGKTEALVIAAKRYTTAQKRVIAGCNANFWCVANQGAQSLYMLGSPLGGVVRNDTVVVNTNNVNDTWDGGPSRTAISAIDHDKNLIFGHFTWAATVSSDRLASPLSMNKINKRNLANELCLWNEYFGRSREFETNWSSGSTQAVNDADNYYLDFAEGSAWVVNKPMTFVVKKIVKDADRQTLGNYAACITATGTMKTAMRVHQEGDVIVVNQGWTTNEPDKEKISPWIENLVEGNAPVMHNGELTGRNYDETYNSQIYSRTGYGCSFDGRKLYMIVIDKSLSPKYGLSAGCSTEVMCHILKSLFPDISEVVNYDAGGSAEMLVDGAIINKTTEGTPRAVATGWLLESIAPADDVVASIRFADASLKLPIYSSYKPQIIAYNQYGDIVNEDLQGFTLACDESLGKAAGEQLTVGGNVLTGRLTANYNGMTAELDITTMYAQPAISLKPVITVDDQAWPLEVTATVNAKTYYYDAANLEWTVEDGAIAVVENGKIRGLQNGKTLITCKIGEFIDTDSVSVEIAPEAFMYQAWDGWTLKGSGASKLSVDENGVVAYTYASTRAPYVKLLKDVKFYSLPDEIGITFLPSQDIEYIQIDVRNLNTSGANYQKYDGEGGAGYAAGKEYTLKVDLDQMGGNKSLNTYPLNIQEIRFVPNKTTATAGAQTIHIKQFYAHYPKQAAPVKGDVNGDGEVNVSDVTALINRILGTASYPDAVCDINADGQVNVSDVTALINMILG